MRAAVADKLKKHWSPAQISRWLRRRWPKRYSWHLRHETIYKAVYRGLAVPTELQTLRTGRTYRHMRGRGRTLGGRFEAVDEHELDPRSARCSAGANPELRQYFPKSINFDLIDNARIAR